MRDRGGFREVRSISSSGGIFELDGRMLLVEVVSVVHVLESYRSFGEGVKVGWIGAVEGMGGVQGINEHRGSPDYPVSQAVESLESRGMVKISELESELT